MAARMVCPGTGSSSDWEAARAAVDVARHAFYKSARGDLQVSGGSPPEYEDHDTRVHGFEVICPAEPVCLILSMRTSGRKVNGGHLVAARSMRSLELVTGL
jgi:hypothetical protein